jgi:Ca-activated chloride channel family protein
VQHPIFGKRYQSVEVQIDEEMLTEIAQMTNGQYFRATDTQSLEKIYDRIDELERTKVEELIYTDYEDLYIYFLLPGILLLMVSLVCERVLFRTALE